MSGIYAMYVYYSFSFVEPFSIEGTQCVSNHRDETVSSGDLIGSASLYALMLIRSTSDNKTLAHLQPLHRMDTELLQMLLVSLQDDLQHHEGELLHASQAVRDAISHIAMLSDLIDDMVHQDKDSESMLGIVLRARADENVLLPRLRFAERSALSALTRDIHEIKDVEAILAYRESHALIEIARDENGSNVSDDGDDGESVAVRDIPFISTRTKGTGLI